MTKYAANAFLATRITFINEIADLSEKVGADVQEVARGIGLDNRIGAKFLHAGPGFGGSSFPKDTRALMKIAQANDVQLRIVEAVLGVNDNRKRAVARKVASAVGGFAAHEELRIEAAKLLPEFMINEKKAAGDDIYGADTIALPAAISLWVEEIGGLEPGDICRNAEDAP